MRIDRCVCTNQAFEVLLGSAQQLEGGLEVLAEATGAGQHCGLCRPYLRACLATGQTVFREVLPVDEHPRTRSRGDRKRVIMSWSGGKDSALALHRLLNNPNVEVVGLLTTVSREFRRISHHGVREELLEQQAAAIGLPLHKVWFPPVAGGPVTMEAFDAHMHGVFEGFQHEGVAAIGYGDIHLESLRANRVERLDRAGLAGIFPLWGEDPRRLLASFELLGFRACLTCVEPVLGRDFAGANLDLALADRLPAGVDPCGENGEYHSFVHAGPVFQQPLSVALGEIVERGGRFYADLLPRSDVQERTDSRIPEPR